MRSFTGLHLRGLIRLWLVRHSQGWRPRHLLVLFIIGGTTLAVSTTAVLSYQIVRGLILDKLKQNALLQVQQGVDDIDQWLVIQKTRVETIASSPLVRSLNWSLAKPYLKSEAERFQEDFFMMVMVTADGLARTTLGGQAQIQDRKHFQQAMTGQLYVSDPLISRTTALRTIVIAAPIWSVSPAPKKPQGVIQGNVKLKRVAQVVGRLKYGEGSYAFALNSEGIPIVYPDHNLLGNVDKPAPSFVKSEDSALAELARKMVGKHQDIELIKIKGQWDYVAYLPLEEADWSIALVIPRSNLEKELHALNLLATVVGGLLSAALVATVVLVSLFELTRSRAETEALLNRLTSRIRSSLNLDQILQTTVEELGNLLHLERATFAWYDPRHETLELCWEYCKEGLPEQLGLFYIEPPGDLGARLQRGELVSLKPSESNSSDSGERGAVELKNHRYLAIPVRTKINRLGYLLVSADRWLGYQEEIELLQAVADSLAIAITQSHLYTQTQEQVKLLDRALTDLKRTQSQLVQSEKMSSLGQLVAGIAHEINNPITFIYGNLTYADEYTQKLLKIIELYRERYPEPGAEIQGEIENQELDFITEDLPQILNSLKQGAERIHKIVLSLRNFSRLDEGEKKDVDIHEGIDNTLLLLQQRLANKIAIRKQYSNLPKVECYPGQLNQVFMNLLTNSVEALNEMEEPEKIITIKTEVIEDSQGKFVGVAIADNGPGIPLEIQSKIFDPFFTTKPVGKGTGLGLAISYQIVTEVHGGQISVQSPLSGGTEVVVKIPIKSPVPS